MHKIIFLVFLGLIAHVNLFAQEAGQEVNQKPDQEEKLTLLLEEREQLTMEYQFLNSQNSNFWGKKSKKDLIQIIQTLKNIINKDSEIIRHINTMRLNKQATINVETGKIKRQVVDDQRLTMENLYQLKQDLASMQNLQKVKDRELLSLRQQVLEARQDRQKSDVIIAVAGVVCLLLLLYIFMLRSKLKPAKTNTRKKKL